MKLKIEKQSLAAGLLAITFLVDTFSVGNVLKFYTDIPRFIFTFILLFLSLAIIRINFRQEFSRNSAFFLILVAALVIIEAGFSLPNLIQQKCFF